MTPVGYQSGLLPTMIARPVLVVVDEISSMIVRRLPRGQPHQLLVMKPNTLYSIFLALVPHPWAEMHAPALQGPGERSGQPNEPAGDPMIRPAMRSAAGPSRVGRLHVSALGEAVP